MPVEDFIITVYCTVDDYFKSIVETPLRSRGEAPALSDQEVLTMEIVGEYLGFGSDTAIWRYFKTHWISWFPKIGCRTSFTRQMANLFGVKKKMQQMVSNKLSVDQDLYLFDGFPIPICHIKRCKRWPSELKGLASIGYCAAKELKYFGFKGHLVTTQHGAIKSFDFAPANIDERDVLPELVDGKISGDLIADKGLIRPELLEELRECGIKLHTPLRKNMKDTRPAGLIKSIMNIRRKIDTVIGQLTERFCIQKIRAKDKWHLMTKITRKLLAHSICFLINKMAHSEDPLKLELLIAK